MFEQELATASRLAVEAGEIVMGLYGDVDVEFKGESNPVTEADRRANDHIVRGLREAFADDGIIAEESDDLSGATKAGRCWDVDPLDGTKEFIKQNGEFAVMIGLAIDGESRLGVVYQPVFDKLYTGVVGGEARLREGDAERVLKVSDRAPAATLRLVVSRSHRSAAVDQLVTSLNIENEVCSGSVGLKIGMIAEQRADLYVNVSNKSSRWDACGPEAILRAAGGCFVELNGDAFRYDDQGVANQRGILACNAASFDEVAPVANEVARTAGLID